jgi:hypothetical protein
MDYRGGWRKRRYSKSITANNGLLSGFRAPLSSVADRMTSTTVTSEHVFLALPEYSETNDPTFPTAVKEPATNGAWTVVQNMNALDNDVTPLDLCQTLLRHMRENQADNKRELVTGQGTAKTPAYARSSFRYAGRRSTGRKRGSQEEDSLNARGTDE